MNEIREFLQSHSDFSFDEGFSLLERYCANQGVVSFIARKRDIKHLSYELGRMAHLPKLRPLKNVHVAENVQVETNPKENVEHVEHVKQPKKPVPSKENDVVKWNNLRHHENTKYEDMPTDYLKGIYKQNRDLYKDLQYAHSQMKLANSDAGRADWRSKVIDIADQIDRNWKTIDDEIQRLNESPEEADSFKETTCRGYISKKLKKDKLKPEEIVEVRKKFEQLKSHGCAIKEETLQKLKNLGVI